MRINRTQDPVLKNRVVFTDEPHPIWRLVIIGVVVIMVSFATWAYFYLPWATKTMVVKTSPINSTVETSPPVATHNTPPVEINHNDDRIKAEQQLLSPAEQPVAAPLVSNPTRSATLETKVESSSESVPKQATILPPTPAKPAETVATLEKTIPPVESPVISEPAIDKSTQIARLLAQAQSQLKLTRLTSPPGDNAYETYQTLRKIAPPEANSVLDNIIAWYYEQGQKYLQRGRLTGTQENNAYQMYQKIKAIAPKHPGAAQLLQGIIEQLQQQFDKQFQRQQFLTPVDHNAYTTYQELLEVAAHPQDTQPLRNKIVTQLLLEAERQLTEKKYITPKQDNAVDTYQKILAIAPKQIEAQQGIQKIVQEYYQKALQEQREEHYRNSLIWVKRGLKIAPDDPQLNKLKQELEDNRSP
jgi:tetratricopeptide (TPR) repeat protein